MERGSNGDARQHVQTERFAFHAAKDWPACWIAFLFAQLREQFPEGSITGTGFAELAVFGSVVWLRQTLCLTVRV
jgi:hypothetical protein